VTIGHHWQCARRLLGERFGDGPIRVRDLAASDISRFLLRHARAGIPAMAKMMVTALRSFFRFLFLSGQTESDLAGAVPTVPQWRSAELPKYLTPEEVERVISACQRGNRADSRDRAILLLVARLGLRAGEVLALELDDVDWRSGELKVRGKGGQYACLPLPADVGEALSAKKGSCGSGGRNSASPGWWWSMKPPDRHSPIMPARGIGWCSGPLVRPSSSTREASA